MTLAGKSVLVTGGTGGIGKETVRRLAELGASVIAVGRDTQRAEAAVEELRVNTGNASIEAISADMSRLRDIKCLAEKVAARPGGLDVLINNAGATRARRELTEDGIEGAFAVNVVAPFCLTHWLLPILRVSGAARVVNITGGIPRGRLDLENLQGERSYVGLSFYNQTKLCQMAMSYRFAEELDGSGVTLNVAYPGHAYTSMNKGLPVDTYPPLARPLVPLLRLAMPVVYGRRALLRATRSSVHLAASPELQATNRTYFGSDAAAKPWPDAVLDETNRSTIWDLCERLRDGALAS